MSSSSARAHAVVGAFARLRRLESTRAGRRLVLDGRPRLWRSPKTGDVIGVQAVVRLYDAKSGAEIPIDPHRVIVNPPTTVTRETSGRREQVTDPKSALWGALWRSVDTTPNPQGWHP